eukprot:maker-scaffold204_size260821-snap-gene-1.31 protein:Tk07810 transcript:maker-scaffold204_size260821-snap-gene-1.31-mRNA-1 annotation:"GJ17509"
MRVDAITQGTKDFKRRHHVQPTSRAQIIAAEAKRRKALARRPVHRAQESLFSWNSAFQNFEGVMNWAFLLLFLGGTRLFLENLNKYGVRVNPSFWLHAIFGNASNGSTDLATLYLILYTHLVVILSLGFEKLLAKEWIHWKLGCTLHVINLVSLLVVPPVVINIKYKNVGPGTPRGKGETKPVLYPGNLNLKNIYYFWLAPTLCYELNFPQIRKIRKLFLMRRLLEVVVGTNIALALIQQWIIPSVVNSLIPFSIPNHLIWLTWFYLTFHSFLNTMGEILGFADRQFYGDWWNANNILTFWKTWNLPVHRWCVRHVFKPVLRNGYSVQSAQVIVFLISAFFHEYLISVPLRVFKTYAFAGMFLQIPLIFLSRWLERVAGPRAGNICVWLSLIIGQPLAVMMYYHDFVVEHYGSELINYFGQLDT